MSGDTHTCHKFQFTDVTEPTINATPSTPQPRAVLAENGHGKPDHVDTVCIIAAGDFPKKSFELLFEIGKRQEQLIAKIADAVRLRDREGVYRLAVELTHLAPTDGIE